MYRNAFGLASLAPFVAFLAYVLAVETASVGAVLAAAGYATLHGLAVAVEMRWGRRTLARRTRYALADMADCNATYQERRRAALWAHAQRRVLYGEALS